MSVVDCHIVDKSAVWNSENRSNKLKLLFYGFISNELAIFEFDYEWLRTVETIYYTLVPSIISYETIHHSDIAPR